MIAEVVMSALALASVIGWSYLYLRDRLADAQEDWERDVRLDDLEQRVNELERNRED